MRNERLEDLREPEAGQDFKIVQESGESRLSQQWDENEDGGVFASDTAEPGCGPAKK